MVSQVETKPAPSETLIRDLLAALDKVFGLHPGFRPVHAKGVMCSGAFVPSPAAVRLTRAPHAARLSTPVVVRFSDSAGLPEIPDNASEGAGPRGMAVRFYLAEHVHTDIVAHSHHGFPVRTGEEFLEMFRAIAASGPEATHPNPIEQFLGAHPRALAHVQAPKPFPTSFAREHFFAMNAFQFVNRQEEKRFGRFRILPEAGTEYLSADDAARQSPNFLMDELAVRLAREQVRYHVRVQLADPADDPADASVARKPRAGRLRHALARQVRRRVAARAAQDHLRPGPARRRHRPVGRPADRSPVGGLPHQRPPPPGGQRTVSIRHSRLVTRSSRATAEC
jgi:catalase